MADGIDAKGIGLAVKDIVIGVAAAAVGAAGGGQAGASGVLKAGDGIDKIINLATSGESRGQKFDRAGFEAKPQSPLVQAPATTPASPPAPTDRDQAVAHLGNVGWRPEQVEKILAGPQKFAMAQIAAPQVEGQRVALAQAKPLELVDGSPVAPVPASALMVQDGKSIPSVTGRRVDKNETAYEAANQAKEQGEGMRYRWEIKTSDTWYAGTDASVFLSLSGLDASMREVQISDPDAINDWEKGDVNHGSIETEDLGELQTGTLRHDQSGPAAGWSVDWVKITNEEDGREWTATVGTFDSGGRFPLLRFSRTNDGQFEEIKKQRAKRATYAADKEAADKVSAKRQAREQAQQQAASEADAELDADLAKRQRELDREMKKAEAEAKLAEQRAKLDQMRSGSAGTPPQSRGTFRTYELFGVLNGGNVPLSQVVLCDANTRRCSVVPGGRVLVAESPGEGFGLAGVPGRWSAIYSGRSPTEFGLDADKGVLASDGSRGWVVTAAFLSQVFGAGWRAAVYS